MRDGRCVATSELSFASPSFVDSGQWGLQAGIAPCGPIQQNIQVTRKDRDGLAEASVIGKWGQVALGYILYCPQRQKKKQLYSSQKGNEKRVHETQG